MTLMEIIDAVKGGRAVTDEQLRFAILALDYLGNMDSMDMMDMLEAAAAGDDPLVATRVQEAFIRASVGFKADPVTFIGWKGNPANPEYQQRRELAKSVSSKLIH